MTRYDLKTLAFRRLDEVCETAPVIPFDNGSRIVFFSDCHRGDGSWRDAFLPNRALFLQALTHYYEKGYTYIEVGDGDDLWFSRRFADIRQTHAPVFDMLHRFQAQQRLHLILGNHDLLRGPRHRVVKDGLVAREGLMLQHAGTEHRLFVVHGHQADMQNDQLRLLSRLTVRHVSARVRVFAVASRVNNRIAARSQFRIAHRIAAWAETRRQPVLCGHTHQAEFPTPNQPRYFNTGCCIHSGSLTGIEINDGRITLVRWIDLPDERTSGRFVAGRQLVRPPVPVTAALAASG